MVEEVGYSFYNVWMKVIWGPDKHRSIFCGGVIPKIERTVSPPASFYFDLKPHQLVARPLL